METSLKLQLDVRNSAQDLQNYILDLTNWEEEMKRKDLALNNDSPLENNIPPPRNKIKRSKPESEKNSNKPKKISAYDYSAWDKFDVEKACAEIDENAKSEEIMEEPVNETEEVSISGRKDDNCESKNFSLIDEAFYEKEMGNKFVKKELWTDAIKCYTNAIHLDSSNAVYYANRSLCFLKLQNFKAAETDATTAIQLDKNYIKAYQRRAFARQALGQISEAKSDYEVILKLEPKNALSRSEINKINGRLKKELEVNKPVEKKTFNPRNMFKSENEKVKIKPSPNPKEQLAGSKIISPKSEVLTSNPNSTKSDSKCKIRSTMRVNNKDNLSLYNELHSTEKGGDGEKILSNQSSKPKHEIFKPLPHWCKIIHPVNIPPHKRSKKPLKKINITLVDKEEFIFSDGVRSECSNTFVKKEEKVVNIQNAVEGIMNEKLSLEIPKTAIQFQKGWKILKKNPEEAYCYLKKIPGSELSRIFENSLESDFFSELVTFLASDDIKKEPAVVYNFLLGLSSVKRFSSLTLFMSEADRRCVKKCLIELGTIKSKEEISELQRLYELKV